ncbi:MAG TPA: hypothetical protein VJN63_05815 [Thermoplasmata archaeon]|nr:hypothetical protein [Thermoplasmata archaeon]
MPILPDIWVAATLGLVMFFLFLGLLVVFTEGVDVRRVLVALLALEGAAVALVAAAEIGLALVILGAFGAIVADDAIERFTGA